MLAFGIHPEHIFEGKYSVVGSNRPDLKVAIKFARKGNVFIITWLTAWQDQQQTFFPSFSRWSAKASSCMLSIRPLFFILPIKFLSEASCEGFLGQCRFCVPSSVEPSEEGKWRIAISRNKRPLRGVKCFVGGIYISKVYNHAQWFSTTVYSCCLCDPKFWMNLCHFVLKFGKPRLIANILLISSTRGTVCQI